MPIINQVVKGGGGSAPAHYIEKTVDANGKLIGGSSVIDLTGVTDVGNYILTYAYYGNTVISGALNFSSLTSISGNQALDYCFYNCTGLTSINLSSLKTVTGTKAMNYSFSGCSYLTSVDLSSLEIVNGNQAMFFCFKGCPRLTSVDISSLKEITSSQGMDSCFDSCSGLTSVTFTSLETLTGDSALSYCFYGCTSLTTLSFPALKTTSFGSRTSQFYKMLSGVTGCTVHFPSNIQSVIGSWSDVTSGFGGTNTTVLFDLPATE